MIRACPPLPVSGESGISGALLSLDCQISQVVENSFARLFGSEGYFGAALTILLTLYIAFLGYSFITGRTQLSLARLSPRVLGLALVLAFVTAWPAYQTAVYTLLTQGPDEIAAALTGSNTPSGTEGPASASQAFARRLDAIFVRLAETATAVERAASQPLPPALGGAVSGPNPPPLLIRNAPAPASDLLWSAGLILLLSTVGLLVLSRLILTLLLALGPVFIVLGLFSQTRGLFSGWLRTALGFAFVPMLVTLGGSAVLALLTPVLLTIASDPASAARNSQPVLILFMGAVIYAALILMLMAVAFMLVRHWDPARFMPGEGDRGPQDPAMTPGPLLGGAQAWAGSGSGAGPAGGNGIPGTAPSGASVRTLIHRMPAPADRSSNPATLRAPPRQGLGQRFRKAVTRATPPPPVSKAPG
jgi:type IV secretion system protein VirB6